jgi:hypothetical protein
LAISIPFWPFLPFSVAARKTGGNQSACGEQQMLTIYSDDHHLHHGRCELIDGNSCPASKCPRAPTMCCNG